MVITFPKQSEAMVTLFHSEGNFSLLFWYALTKPPELQEISVDGSIVIVGYNDHTL